MTAKRCRRALAGLGVVALAALAFAGAAGPYANGMILDPSSPGPWFTVWIPNPEEPGQLIECGPFPCKKTSRGEVLHADPFVLPPDWPDQETYRVSRQAGGTFQRKTGVGPDGQERWTSIPKAPPQET